MDELLKNTKPPLKIVVGAGGVFEPGWIPTEIDVLNLLKPDDWRRYFTPGSLDAILAEHVWEHLTLPQGTAAAQTCFKYLKPGGYVRAAVPDGLHPDAAYIEWVRPGGVGPGADDHKVLFTYKTFADMFRRVGFMVKVLEYFDENGAFNHLPWSAAEGLIHRSKEFDRRNQGGGLKYTSIILDATK